MRRKVPIKPNSVEFEAVVRKRNQITLPSQAIDGLGLHEGDTIVIQLQDGSATLRPVRRSYAGVGRGAFGNAREYLERERGNWE
jgi:AbrB family looped-hinge helix DNA binding protein